MCNVSLIGTLKPTHSDSGTCWYVQAHGAEILCSKYSNGSDTSADTDDIPQSTDARWLRFVAALSDKGYFKVCLHLSLSLSLSLYLSLPS